MMCDVKSEVGNVRKFSHHDPPKDADASVQKRKQFESCTNDNSDKSRKFANVAIQKPRDRKPYRTSLLNKTVNIQDSGYEYEELTQFADIIRNQGLDHFRTLPAQTNESALVVHFSRFHWLASGEAAIGSKTEISRFNSMY
jgi:hypothetical protein